MQPVTGPDDTPEVPISGGPHTCDLCGRPADACYRDGMGTGHSEHVCACKEHGQDPMQAIGWPFR